MKPISHSILYLIIGILFSSCSGRNSNALLEEPVDTLSWQEVKENGILRAVTDFNSINYYILNGRPMGFQYELLDYFSKSVGLRFTVEALPELNDIFRSIHDKKYDIIALNLTPLPGREEMMLFTDPILYTRQVLVQKKPAGYDTLRDFQLPEYLITSLIQLKNKSIIVHENSSFSSVLKKIRDSLDIPIQIIEVTEKTEKLVEMVSRGDADYTVCDELAGIVYQNKYPNLDITFSLTEFENLNWGIRRDAPALRDSINKWLEGFKKTLEYAIIFNRYYRNQYFVNISNSNLYSINTGRISYYDELIKKHSPIIGWDWRLIASMIYLESKFRTDASSHKGAFGIMQLMPETAKRYGVSESSSTENQIKAGIHVLYDVYAIFGNEINDSIERIKFSLAAYNIGIGHIRDAQIIAKKIGKSPYVWDKNVDSCLLMKSLPQYYNDPDIQFGYCVGKQTVKYVFDIMDLYSHYKNIVPK